MKSISIFLIVIASSLLPAVSNAAGSYTPGTVSISTQSSGVHLQGFYNVRHNPNVNGGYISIGGSATQTIGVLARASNTGEFYFCSAAPGTAMHAAMEKIMAVAGNGAILSVIRNSNGQCTAAAVNMDSQAID